MPLNDLRDFLALLEGQGELARVRVEVDPLLEIAQITDRVCNLPGGGRALLFERPKGHRFAVATNLFGSATRMAGALEAASFDEIATRMSAALAEHGEGDAQERLRRVLQGGRFAARLTDAAPCRQVAVADPDLRTLPALKNWPEDGGRFLTLPLVFTRDPESGRINCGMVRVQILDKASATLHWSAGSDGARIAQRWGHRGLPMPVAIALGGPPALIYAAAAPLPAQIDETEFAGWLRGEPVTMTPCRSSDLLLPAAAEFVLEGVVHPGECALEGPFGNHTGFYAPAAPAPVLRLETLTHRVDPILPCTVVGPPPMENLYFGRATEKIFLPLIQAEVPEVADIHFLAEGVYHGAALVALTPEGAGRGVEIARRLWRTRLFGASRLLVAIDAGLDPAQRSAVLWRALNQVDPAADVLVEGGRIAVDATDTGGRRRLRADDETVRRVARRWERYGLGADIGENPREV